MDPHEKEEVMQRLRALEAQVGTVRGITTVKLESQGKPTSDEVKQDIVRRLEYLQAYVEGIDGWK